MLVAGIDEAGRGPVIGPMVICLAITDKENEKMLRDIGVKDSKLLSPEKRQQLSDKIKEICKVHFVIITAKKINEQMKNKSLNEIEANYIEKLIRSIDEKTMNEIEKIYIDVPDPVPIKFLRRLKLKREIVEKIHPSHKADVRFPICSAASIIAKVIRDEQIEKIKEELQCDFGNGYTHDPLTIECLKKNIDNKQWQKYLRMKWDTVKKIIREKKFGTKQVKLFEDD
jgi:ribonuclease HII